MNENTSPITVAEEFSTDSNPVSYTVSDSISAPLDNAISDALLTPKPGTKYAAPDEDFGAMPVSATPDYAQSDRSLNNSGTGETLTPKPGTKYAS